MNQIYYYVVLVPQIPITPLTTKHTHTITQCVVLHYCVGRRHNVGGAVYRVYTEVGQCIRCAAHLTYFSQFVTPLVTFETQKTKFMLHTCETPPLNW